MCFGLKVINKVEVASNRATSTCSSCHLVSGDIWIQLTPCMGESREICIACANKICADMGWKHFDHNGARIDPPPPPPRPELASNLIAIYNLWGAEDQPVISVQLDEKEIGKVDFDDYLAIHIRQVGPTGKSTNCGGRTNPETIIEEIVKAHDKERFLLDFRLEPTLLTPKLMELKKQLDCNKKIYNDAMSGIDQILRKYVDRFGRCGEVTDESDRKRHIELGQIYNYHLYYPQIGAEFIANLKIMGHPALNKLPQDLVWRVTQIEMDYEDPTMIQSLIISGLF